MRAKAKLCRFASILPQASMPQMEILKWIADRHENALLELGEIPLKKIFSRYGVDPKKIERRYFDLPDHVENSSLDLHLFPKGGPVTQIGEKMLYFKNRSTEIFEDLYRIENTQPFHIIHVTCTGYTSPSSAQRFADKMNLQVSITHAYHMGCYAAMPAIRMAEAFLQNESDLRSVDIVHTEICSLHIDVTDHSPEQIVVQSLFADGHIKYSVVNAQSNSDPGFIVICVKEQLIPRTTEMMTWVPQEWGIGMTLSREVPAKIREHIRPFIQSLCRESGFELADVIKNAKFAIHPGGPKIIDSVHEALELQEGQSRASREVLFERGNMSSSTLPHVWKKMEDQGLQSGQLIVSLAFGPGLTIFGSIFIYA